MAKLMVKELNGNKVPTLWQGQELHVLSEEAVRRAKEGQQASSSLEAVHVDR
jgi:hypothetical protein